MTDEEKIDCPIAGCAVTILPRKVMCYAHWKLLPNTIKLAMKMSYGTESHPRVCALAKRAVEQILFPESL